MNTVQQQQPFGSFLSDFKARLHHLFHVRGDIDKVSTARGLPPYMLREIMSGNPLSTYIPAAYGGRGGHIHEGIALTAAASYESLPLALGFGINWALFLQPVGKYAESAAKEEVFSDFLNERKMGGLMITEPDYGSDALHMKTSYRAGEGGYQLKGTKHWAGLTGWADYWLLTARKQKDDGGLQRDIDFFICDANAPEQNIVVEEVYENLGVYMLPYGRNRIDVTIPRGRKLIPHSTGIKMMLDLLHRSRMQFPGMGLGFLQRMLDEAVEHTQQRMVGGRSLFSYDQVQQRIARMQAAHTICSAMCLNSSGKAQVDNDLSAIGLEANAVKTYVTDLMQSSAQSLLQLVGAKGYRLNHIAGRAIVDSRPFQIFEGSNDILYIQIAEAVQKQMARLKQSNLFEFVKQNELTCQAAAIVREQIDFNLKEKLTQRKQTELGELFSRIVAVDQVVRLGQSGYHGERIDNAVVCLGQEISALVSGFQQYNNAFYSESEEGDMDWLDCFRRA